MNWNSTKIDLGTLRVRQVTVITYIYIGINPELLTQSSFLEGCGCSIPKWSPEDKSLTVVYTPNPIPPQLKFQNKHSYHSEKYIIVNYPNGNSEKLIFTATIVE